MPHAPEDTLRFAAFARFQTSRSEAYRGLCQVIMMRPTGELGSDALRLVKLVRQAVVKVGSVVTSDAGLLIYRELDGALRFIEQQ